MLELASKVFRRTMITILDKIDIKVDRRGENIKLFEQLLEPRR